MNELTVVLEREVISLPADEPSDAGSLCLKLARDARHPLKHDAFLNHLEQQQSDPKIPKIVTAKSLATLDLSPYSALSVEKYKSAALQRARGVWGQIEYTLLRMLLWGCFGGLVVGLAATCLAAISKSHGLARLHHTADAWIVPSLLVACVCGVIRLVWAASWDFRQEWSWKLVPFNYQYEKLVENADFVMDTAVRVKANLPVADLYIEELSRGQRVIDLFLVLDCGGERYYLEVWGEKNYARETPR